MFEPVIHHLPMPRSLRWQFILAFVLLELLIVAGSLTALYALRSTTDATRNMAEVSLVRLQDAQDVVQRTLLIERETDRMLVADSVREMNISYEEIIREMEQVDHLVQYLGTASTNISVLELLQADQLFRNTAHIVAGLREEELRLRDSLDPAEKEKPAQEFSREEKLRHFHAELQHQVVAMVAAARNVSARFTSDYREAVQRVANQSISNQRWVMVLFFGSLIMTWVVAWYFLGRHVLVRLQEVSNYLRGGNTNKGHPQVPVQGRDEIGEMARAVEHFLEDRERLNEANQELEAFSYSISHDLRAPLRAISGFSQILLEDYGSQLDEEGKGYLERIGRNVIRMRDLIDDILDFSRMSRRGMSKEKVDMTALVKEVFEEVRGSAPGRSIVLQMNELLPATADRSLIYQVLVNLLSNAIKFTAQRAEAKIEVTSINKGEENLYCVKDNGIGFDMKYASQLFGVFQRLSGSEKFEGTGIGLAIVKRIIVRHGGRVWAESEPGEGTSMYFTLVRG